MPRLPKLTWPIVGAALLAASVPVLADSDDAPPQSSNTRPQFRTPAENHRRAVGEDEVEGPTILEGIPALNPIDAFRDDLRDDHGIYLHGIYLGDPYADIGGGMRRGATFSGRLDVELDLNLQKLLGLPDFTVHANMFGIHGSDLSRGYIGTILSSNDIAALPTARLYELWIERRFGDTLSVRAGQQGIDVEFLTSDYAANFIDATFGWPAPPSVDLPDGAPAYPLATPAVRARFTPTANLTILAAVFDGVPAGPCPGDPQNCDTSGTNFRISDPPLAIVEGQWRYNQGKQASGLPGTLKVGAYAHFGQFDDQRLSANGFPLSAAGAAATPLTHTPNGAGYAIVDQQIFRVSDDEPERGIGVFARAIGAPSDRNAVDLYFDTGFSALGLIPGRPHDFFGIAGAFARISPQAADADLEADIASGRPAPVRNYEAMLEATYYFEICPGLAVQPTAQYFIHPGGHIANPYGDGLTAIPNAEVFGLTTTVRF